MLKSFFAAAKSAVVSDKPKISRENEYDYTGLVPPVTYADVFRYRYHHGCNIGSIFVLERWLRPSAFPKEAPPDQTSELAAVSLSMQSVGIEATRKAFQKRWELPLDTQLRHWLASKACCTTIRLPIGYFTLGPEFCVGTPFEPYGEVYVNAWAMVKKIIQKYRKFGIGTLIDFHALPGGANSQNHSGTDAGSYALWTTPRYMDLAKRCLEFIAKEALAMEGSDGVVGLQIVNESAPHVPNMYEWYNDVIEAITAIDPTLPVYISDAWDLPTAIKYAQKLDFDRRQELCPVVIDTHYYACFSDADKALTPEQLIAKVPNHLAVLEGKCGSVIDRGALQVVVGEYSCVFAQESWDKAGYSEHSPQGQTTVANFARVQNESWQQRAGGSYFWTLLMDWAPGGAWGFTSQVESDNIPIPPQFQGIPLLVNNAVQRAITGAEDYEDQCVREHSLYWQGVAPQKEFEHWRYRMGWQVGWNDAGTFAVFKICNYFPGGGDHIGMVDSWVRKRLIDARMSDSAFEWEFEHGLRAGIKAFEKRAGMRSFPMEMGTSGPTRGHFDTWVRRKGLRGRSKSREQENAPADTSPPPAAADNNLLSPNAALSRRSRRGQDRSSAMSGSAMSTSGLSESDIMGWLSTNSTC